VDPISLIIIAAVSLLGGATAAAGAVSIAYLTLPQVRAWFEARRAVLFNRDLVAMTIVDALATGQYRTVQGIFNTRTRTWNEYRTIESSQIGPDLAALHWNRRVVTHTV
jgi:hypothetical protein